MGYGIASLNLSLLLEKNDVFRTEEMMLGELARKELGPAFDLNKQIALKYLQLSMMAKDTEHDHSFEYIKGTARTLSWAVPTG